MRNAISVRNATIAACLFVGIGIVAGFTLTVIAVPSKLTVVNDEVSLQDVIDERTDAVLASKAYQEEMYALAKARALYQLSNERQDIAVELSEMALASYNRNQELGQLWFSQ